MLTVLQLIEFNQLKLPTIYLFSYPDYRILHNPDVSTDTTMEGRRETHGLIAYVTDLKLLQECDFFVGTLSSNVSTVKYELYSYFSYFMQ